MIIRIKQYIQNIYTSLISFGSLMLLMMALGLSSCAVDDSLGPFSKGSNDSTIVSLTFSINDGVRTRSITAGNENLVSDITVMVFDTNGSLIGSKYVTSALVASIDVPVTTRSATGCTIYAIANTGSSSYFAGINTISQLNGMSTTISSPFILESNGSTVNSTGALMVGKSPADISKGGANKFSITLYHQCGKFSFTINPATGVTITGYQLCHVPLSSYITDSHVPVTASDVAGPPAGAGSYGNFDAVSGLSQTTSLSKTYYVYENLCGSNNSVTDEKSRNSSNAPSTASYLLVNAKCGIWTSTYRIYLGGVTNTATPATDLTNFNVYRNLNYNCTISLGTNGGNGDARVSYTATISTRSNMCMGDATVGNYLYDDSTNGTVYNPGHTVGIIYSNQLTLSQYNAGCRHGRVLALKDAYSTICAWSSNSAPNNLPYADQTVHPYCQIFSTCFNDVSSGYDASNSAYVGLSSNPAWYYCNIYNDGTTHTGSLAGRNWYLPSAGDWWDIMENLCTWTDPQKTTIKGMRTSPNGIGTYLISASGYYSNFDSKLTAAAGSALSHSSYYWSASEYNSINAVIVNFYSAGVYVNGNGTYNLGNYARAVLAY